MKITTVKATSLQELLEDTMDNFEFSKCLDLESELRVLNGETRGDLRIRDLKNIAESALKDVIEQAQEVAKWFEKYHTVITSEKGHFLAIGQWMSGYDEENDFEDSEIFRYEEYFNLALYYVPVSWDSRI